MNFQRNNNIWISYSAISDFEACPRLYYFRSIFRNSRNRRIQIVNPYLTLGTVVHKTLEDMGRLPEKEKFKVPLKDKFEENWQLLSGKRGGFDCSEREEEFKNRGHEMINRTEESETLKKKNHKLADDLLKVRLFKDENVILVGAIDWVELLDNKDLHIIDFKTGRSQESKNSLQLPIYLILASYNFNKPVKRTSYWYLDRDTSPVSFELDPVEEYVPIVREKARKIQQAISNNDFSCRSGNGKCFKCREYEAILNDQAEYLGYDRKTNKDLYFLP